MIMTFDDGTNTANSSQAQVTESLIRLLAQIALSLGIVTAYLVLLIQGKIDTATILQPVVLGVIAFWLGQSITSAAAGVKHAQIKAQVTQAQLSAGTVKHE